MRIHADPDVRFVDRVDAGRQLAARLKALAGDPSVVVLGLPRGGVPVAAEVASALGAPLDVIVVRKLGLPFQPEVAMGAIGEGGVRVVDQRIIAMARVPVSELDRVTQRETEVLRTRAERLRRGRERLDLTGCTAVVVDDGLATGSTARAACRVARGLGATRIVLAVPVAPPSVLDDFADADEVVCVSAPRDFYAVGSHYDDFSPTSDDEVVVLLDEAARRERMTHAATQPPDCDVEVTIPVDGSGIAGHLHLPEPASAVVIFAHGSGSSRHSPRNRLVASVLYDAGLGTLLLDLLTPEEEFDRDNVFDIDLLAERLVLATQWVVKRQVGTPLRVGYFGASTGAGAALRAAAAPGARVSAVVSRGGRPDLAGEALTKVTAPTLLIVGGADHAVLELNQQALRMMPTSARLEVVEGAGHLFEEPGALAEVAILARDWFAQHLLLPAESEEASS
ncbi:phosphoribosyltransferase family protein [Aeromicrobium sp.]|uniref:phosphoribosyltransferase family protein n=1 Tax=Aeromicrobium sp. TaxID=1871063 RepID=UPI002FC5D1B9